jgi:hypothetical protein
MYGFYVSLSLFNFKLLNNYSNYVFGSGIILNSLKIELMTKNLFLVSSLWSWLFLWLVKS